MVKYKKLPESKPEKPKSLWADTYEAHDDETYRVLTLMDDLDRSLMVKVYPNVEFDDDECMKYVVLMISMCRQLRGSDIWVLNVPTYKFRGYSCASPFLHLFGLTTEQTLKHVSLVVRSVKETGAVEKPAVARLLQWTRLLHLSKSVYGPDLLALRCPYLKHGYVDGLTGCA